MEYEYIYDYIYNYIIIYNIICNYILYSILLKKTDYRRFYTISYTTRISYSYTIYDKYAKHRFLSFFNYPYLSHNNTIGVVS